jgi:hypothetical protein
LKALAEVVAHKRQNMVKAKATPGTKADLGDPNKWSIADVSTHGKIMKQLQADLSDTSDIRERFSKSLQEIESDMLKGIYAVSAKNLRLLNLFKLQRQLGRRKLSGLTRRPPTQNSRKC